MKADIEGLRATILERQEKRLRVLVQLYVETCVGHRVMRTVDAREVAISVGVDSDESRQICAFFIAEALIENGTNGSFLTHKGMLEVENAIVRPDLDTEHFPRAVIMHFHGTVGAVQTGKHARADVEQK